MILLFVFRACNEQTQLHSFFHRVCLPFKHQVFVFLEKTLHFDKIKKHGLKKKLLWPKLYDGSKFNHLICIWLHHLAFDSKTSREHWILNTLILTFFILWSFSEFMHTTIYKAIPSCDLFLCFFVITTHLKICKKKMSVRVSKMSINPILILVSVFWWLRTGAYIN